jgi:hypothetical protein
LPHTSKVQRTSPSDDHLVATQGLPAMVAAAREGKTFTGCIYDALGTAKASLAADRLGQIFADAASRPSSALDSHPPVGTRLARLYLV